MSEETKETTVKSEAENIVEREFASLRTQLEEAEASKKEIESEFKKAMKELEVFKKEEEDRLTKEAEARKVRSSRSNYIPRSFIRYNRRRLTRMLV
jgi:uncharacterized protein (DUF3084 family)